MIRSSLIILNYEGADVLGPCLASVLTAAGPSDEVIVVDNASTDGSAELALASTDPRVKVILRTANNFIFGLNDGVAASDAQFVAFLNNDMTVDPDFVERCLSAFDSDAVFAVCPRILQMTGQDQGALTAGRWHRGLLFYDVVEADPAGARGTFFAVGGQSFFDRRKLLALGSIDELFWPMYYEDIELSYRAWKAGWAVRYEHSAVAHHAGSISTRRRFSDHQLRTMIRQNEHLHVWKNIDDPRLLAAHMLWTPMRLLAALLNRDWATLHGFAAACMRLPACRRARKSRRLQILSDAEVLHLVSARSLSAANRADLPLHSAD